MVAFYSFMFLIYSPSVHFPFPQLLLVYTTLEIHIHVTYTNPCLLATWLGSSNISDETGDTGDTLVEI